MKDLIEALNIFLKYGDPHSPTHCDHDVLYVMAAPDAVSEEDRARLEELSFHPNDEWEGFYSYRFGSA